MALLLHPMAAKYLDRLNEPDKSRIKIALQKLEAQPPEGDIIPLAGNRNTFRLKISKYRVIFRYENDSIYVTNIDPRGQSYKKKNAGGYR